MLLLLYATGVLLRLVPRLALDPHLLTFEADVWYRLALAQHVLDHGRLPIWDLRYEAYGHVPTWYPPLTSYALAGLSRLFSVDLPTLCSRVLPFFEALTPLSFYLVARALYGRGTALMATGLLALTPCFIFWTGIANTQSLTLFHIPLAVLLWIRYVEGRPLLGRPRVHLALMGLMLALNFLFHLTYFLLVLTLVAVHLGLVLEGRTTLRRLWALLVPVAISQLLTAWWWAPPHLYWWWTQALVTSSGRHTAGQFFQHYGVAAAVLGHAALALLLIIALTRRRTLPAYWLVPVMWAIIPMVESQNENLLTLMGRQDLSWMTLVKPLEGFRFYCFLAQPLALCAGLAGQWGLQRLPVRTRRWQTATVAVTALALVGVLWGSLWNGYRLAGRFQNAGIMLEEYDAARWFRAHAAPTDRIIADYYTAQMFIGVAGGRALEGAPFPLRNVSIPYISDGWRVQRDLCEMYTTDDPQRVALLMRRYGGTHIAHSSKILRHIEHITRVDTVLEDLEGLTDKDYSSTLFNPAYFDEVYRNGDVRIFKLRAAMEARARLTPPRPSGIL